MIHEIKPLNGPFLISTLFGLSLHITPPHTWRYDCMSSLFPHSSKFPPYWRSLHEWMSPLNLFSTSPILVSPQLFETGSSLLEWISPLSLLSTSPMLSAPQFPEATSEASSRVAC